MSQPVATLIGPYRIEREIARGGMGIVYLAHDTRLDRTVALKALPADVANDPERLHRFEREAKLLASLNHPNIAAIYDIAEGGGHRYLALEHVEGETLAQRLAGGALPMSEAIELCLQIASGMEAAHERGVIHRDLKPGNVMIGLGDQVKIVDFGLAKGRVAAEGDMGQSPAWAPGSATGGSPQSPTGAPIPNSPTISSPTFTSPALSPGTIPGIILGTAPYLSPEQARGKVVDRRTDIWSYGCVLYECLTGKRAFDGETVSDTVARILEREPDWSALPKATPTRVVELLHRSLEKDPRRRLRDMGEARLALEEVRAGTAASSSTVIPAGAYPATARPRTWFDRVPSGVMLAIGLLLGGALSLRLAGHPAPWESGAAGAGSAVRGPVDLSVWIPSDLRALDADLTPDGKTIVLKAVHRARTEGGAEPRPMLYTRRLDQRNFEPVRGSEGVLGFQISADGRWIGFGAPISERSTKRRLSVVAMDGSAPPAPLLDADGSYSNGSAWLETGDILFGLAGGQQYVRLDRKTLTVSPPRRFDAPGFTGQFSLEAPLPNDRGALLKGIFYQNGIYHEGIGVLDLKSGKSKMVIQDGSSPRYSPTGHLLFTRGGTLLAAPFDLDHLAVTAEPVAIVGGLRVAGGTLIGASFELSRQGTLLYTLGSATMHRHVIVVDRNGAVSAWSSESGPFKTDIVSSPDGSRMATVLTNENALDEIWISHRGESSLQKIVAVPGNDCDSPRWSRDQRSLAFSQFSQKREDGVYVVSAAGGSPPRAVSLVESPGDVLLPNSWLAGDSRILCLRQRSEKRDLVVVDVPSPGSPPSQPKPLLTGSADYFEGDVSPDGRLLAYVSNESGSREAFVRELQADGSLGSPLQVSLGGAQFVVWDRPGTTLNLFTPDRKVYKVTITTKSGLAATPPSLAWDLEKLGIATYMIDPLPDGRAVAIQKGDDEDELTHFDITLNFFDELKARFKEKP
jgi:serine/threonine-protein kinase